MDILYLEDGLPGLVSGFRITTIYEPWNSHLKGILQPYLGDENDHHGLMTTYIHWDPILLSDTSAWNHSDFVGFSHHHRRNPFIMFFLRVVKLRGCTVHPGRLTWNLQITHLERKMVWTKPPWGHVPAVNLPGCTETSLGPKSLTVWTFQIPISYGTKIESLRPWFVQTKNVYQHLPTGVN